MSATAVLMCMAAGGDPSLARQAVSTTGSALRSGDAIFLHVDGAENYPEGALREAAAKIPIHFVFSSARIGLAAGLNKLINICLAESQWQFFARMDADDQCLPDRFQLQRNYLSADPRTDILGGRCREVDEHGRHLRTKKLPLTHEQIMAHLPRRNPLNHPTVMVRRRVFEDGLRYRMDVGLVEDWYLWIDAAVGGRRFSNQEEEVLVFRRSSDFFRKRGGITQIMAEWRVRAHARRALGMGSPSNFFYALGAMLARATPAGFQKILYRLVG